ncbi:MAG: hypothetical protein DSM106950_40550 [Stigonema ocellatum SAG 48.90 = DSM 106950]|nr:hypothetical protein [Stigonema ocellatum SAG 48.90 = DSM 106950]
MNTAILEQVIEQLKVMPQDLQQAQKFKVFQVRNCYVLLVQYQLRTYS